VGGCGGCVLGLGWGGGQNQINQTFWGGGVGFFGWGGVWGGGLGGGGGGGGVGGVGGFVFFLCGGVFGGGGVLGEQNFRGHGKGQFIFL